MRIIFLFSLYFCIHYQVSAQTLQLSGVYQGTNLFVQNPLSSSGKSNCIKEIYLNNEKITDIDLKLSAFIIDLSHHEYGENLILKIIHHEDCTPKIVNPQAIERKRMNFHFQNAYAANHGIVWTTVGEISSGRFAIQRKEGEEWSDFPSITGKHHNGYNHYEYHINHNDGENRYRIVYYASNGKNYLSNEFVFNKKHHGNHHAVFKHLPNKILLHNTMDFEIVDMLGTKIMSGRDKEINVSFLKAGTYFLNTSGKSEKFVISR